MTVTTHSTPLGHRLLLAMAGVAWLVSVGGNLYAEAFVTNVSHNRLAIMSPRTFTEVVFVWVGWGIAMAALLLCGVTLALFRRSRTLVLAAIVSALYALPLLFILIV